MILSRGQGPDWLLTMSSAYARCFENRDHARKVRDWGTSSANRVPLRTVAVLSRDERLVSVRADGEPGRQVRVKSYRLTL